MAPKADVLEEQNVRLRFVNFVVLPAETLQKGRVSTCPYAVHVCPPVASPQFRVAGAF